MRIVVDDRAFVVGLSELFRQEMKRYEVARLLPAAETACTALGLPPADVPIEGYYTESPELERFFRLIRTLQNTDIPDVFPNSAEDAILRLRETYTSPAMGRLERNDRLLPRTTSPFGEALQNLSKWSIAGLCEEAQKLVRADDSGLVAVAAATGDPIALCAARESMALSAEVELAAMESPKFAWEVSERVAEVGGQFVSALASATGIVLPPPVANSSVSYGQAASDARLIGRCILIGQRLGTSYPYYHWYIHSQNGEAAVKEFSSSDVWTTDSLRSVHIDGRPAMGAQVGAPPVRNEPSAKSVTLPPLARTLGETRPHSNGWFSRLFRRPAG